MRQLASRSILVLALLAAVLAWPEPAAWAETTAEQQSRIEQLRQESASLQRQGEPDQAIQRAAKAVELSNSVYGPSHPELAASLYGLAELHHMGGRYRDAEPLYRQALGIWERAEPPESGRLAGNSAIVGRALLQSETLIPQPVRVVTRQCDRALILARRRAFFHCPSYHPRHEHHRPGNARYLRRQIDGRHRRAV